MDAQARDLLRPETDEDGESEGEAKAFLEKFKKREKADAYIVRSKG